MTHHLDFKVSFTIDARIRDGDRVINTACAGRRISPMLITPFTEFTEGHRYRGTDGITGTGVRLLCLLCLCI